MSIEILKQKPEIRNADRFVIAKIAYRRETRENRLTPESVTNFWRSLYALKKPTCEIQISRAELIGKDKPQTFLTETKGFKAEVSRFPDTTEGIEKHRKLGMEPVYVSEQLLGINGVFFLKNFVHDDIHINVIPKVENKKTQIGWQYVEVDPYKFINIIDQQNTVIDPTKIQEMNYQTYIIMAYYMNKIYGFLPDILKIQKSKVSGEASKEDKILEIRNTNTFSSLGGSTFGLELKEYKKPKPLFSFNVHGEIITTYPEDTADSLTIKRSQVPVV